MERVCVEWVSTNTSWHIIVPICVESFCTQIKCEAKSDEDMRHLMGWAFLTERGALLGAYSVMPPNGLPLGYLCFAYFGLKN